MYRLLTCVFIALYVLCISSCDRPECTNENAIFETRKPHSKIYKDELVAQIQARDQSELRYWLKKYDDQNGKESLYFNVQGDGLCAILHLTVNDWNKLEHVREKKGVGRRGAEFTNLQYNITQGELSTDFGYISYDRIID